VPGKRITRTFGGVWAQVSGSMCSAVVAGPDGATSPGTAEVTYNSAAEELSADDSGNLAVYNANCRG
jgi:hypothetical protein